MAVDILNTIIRGMHTHIYELEELKHYNGVLTTSNSEVMAQLTHMTVTMNAMQAQMKPLSLTTNNPTGTRIKFYC